LDRLSRMAYPSLVTSRNSEGDMGRLMGETKRRTAQGVVAANFRRAEEALRVLEEYGKVLSPQSVAGFKALRFRLYLDEKRGFLRSES